MRTLAPPKRQGTSKSISRNAPGQDKTFTDAKHLAKETDPRKRPVD